MKTKTRAISVNSKHPPHPKHDRDEIDATEGLEEIGRGTHNFYAIRILILETRMVAIARQVCFYHGNKYESIHAIAKSGKPSTNQNNTNITKIIYGYILSKLLGPYA